MTTDDTPDDEIAAARQPDGRYRPSRLIRDLFRRAWPNNHPRPADLGYLYCAPISIDPPTGTEPVDTTVWMPLGYASGGYAYDDDGPYDPRRARDRPDYIHWAGPTRMDRNAIYGGPPADPEWPCISCGYHNTGGVCTHCGIVRTTVTGPEPGTEPAAEPAAE